MSSIIEISTQSPHWYQILYLKDNVSWSYDNWRASTNLRLRSSTITQESDLTTIVYTGTMLLTCVHWWPIEYSTFPIPTNVYRQIGICAFRCTHHVEGCDLHIQHYTLIHLKLHCQFRLYWGWYQSITLVQGPRLTPSGHFQLHMQFWLFDEIEK